MNFEDNLPYVKKPTDCYCVVFYLFFMALVFFGMFYGVNYGNLRNVAQPFDQDGNACGRGDYKDFPMLFFNSWVLDPNAVKNTICISECPAQEAQLVKCKPNTVFKDCADLNAYPSRAILNRFCISRTSEKELKTIVGKASSVITTGAMNFDGVKNNAIK